VKNELKWFFWIFGCFSDIGYVKTMASGIAGKARNHSISYRRFTNPINERQEISGELTAYVKPGMKASKWPDPCVNHA